MTFRPFFLVLLAAFSLHADVIYSNFGVDGGYATGTGLMVTNDGISGASVAIGFTPSDNFDLTSIEFVATSLIPGGAGASIGIFADEGGHPGATSLESFSLDGLLGNFGNAVPVLTVTSSLQPLLQANTLYWIGMQGPAGGLAIWNLNSTLAGGISSTDGAGQWLASDAPQGVIEIDGTLAPPTEIPVPDASNDPTTFSPTESSSILTPEPQTGGLLLIGGFALLAACQLRSRLTYQK